MVKKPVESTSRVRELEERVIALEQALTRRSEELQQIIAHVGPDALHIISRVLRGLPALPQLAVDLEEWQESTELRAAEVPETVQALWRSLADQPRGHDEHV
jgi:hypothetical protein